MTSRQLLTEFRRAVGWAQPKLASELGVQVSTVKRWEASQEPPERRLALAIEALRQRAPREPQRLGSRANQGVPTDARPQCESCGSDMYKLGDQRTSSRWESRSIQDYGCRRRWRRGKNACPSRRRVPYFVDSIVAGNPERVPEVHGWARGRPKQDVGFDRQLAHCPLKNCPRNQEGTFLYPGMGLAWKEPRALNGYPEFGKVMKLRCWGSSKQPHKQVTAFWNYKLRQVVELPDPYRGHKKLDWWEGKHRDTCSECSSELRGAGTVKKGPMKGMRKKVCPSKKPHKGSKINYFDPGTSARRKVVIGRADLPENARICPGCGSNLKAGGRCIDHPSCHLMLCKNPLHRKHHGSRQHHWDLQKKQFIPHSRRKPLPQKARKVEIRNCPRCKEPMSWRMRKGHVQFLCPGCMRRHGQTWIIRVNFDNSKRGRTKGRA